jgi:hypothetical protein
MLQKKGSNSVVHCGIHVTIDYINFGDTLTNSNIRAEQQAKIIKKYNHSTKNTALAIATGFENQQNLRKLMGENKRVKELQQATPGRFNLFGDSDGDAPIVSVE